MSGLLRDVAVYARGVEGQLKLERRLIGLRFVIDAALETCVAALQEKHQTAEVLASGRIMLNADRLRLQQVFANLVLNAS